MPWATRDKHRAYQKAYNQKPEVKERNRKVAQARRAAIKAGKKKTGDGKDTDHIKPLSKGGTNHPSNIRVVSASKNRGYKRGRPGNVKQR